VELLLAHGADIDAPDAAQGTALMWAAQTGQPAMVRLLLERGADAHARNEAGLTALMEAKEYGNAESRRCCASTRADAHGRQREPAPRDRAPRRRFVVRPLRSVGRLTSR
jgi:ankyrin repeat protein